MDDQDRDIVVEPDRVVEQPPFFEIVSEECRRKNMYIQLYSCCPVPIRFSPLPVQSVPEYFSPPIFKQPFVSDLRKKNKLAPAKYRPAQVLTEGMLLHRGPNSFSILSGSTLQVNICRSCAFSLRHNKTLALYLTNGMWIRDIPFVLRVLTLPKRILVACYFLAVIYRQIVFHEERGPLLVRRRLS